MVCFARESPEPPSVGGLQGLAGPQPSLGSCPSLRLFIKGGWRGARCSPCWPTAHSPEAAWPLLVSLWLFPQGGRSDWIVGWVPGTKGKHLGPTQQENISLSDLLESPHQCVVRW